MSSLSLELQALRESHETLTDLGKHIAAGRWLNACAITILCYDTFLTLSDEVELLWPKKWSLIKVFTHLNRFLSLVFISLNAVHLVALRRGLSNLFCEVVLVSTGFGAFIGFAACNWILLARTKALLGDTRWINHLLVAYYLAAYAATGVFVTHTSVSLISKIFYSNTMKVCAIVLRPKSMGLIWVPPMIFETTIFVVTILKLYQKASETHQLGSNLLGILYRDGVCYYLIMIGLRVWNLMAWMVLPTSFIFTGLFLLWAVMTISVTRLQVNLIKAVDPRYHPSATFGHKNNNSTSNIFRLTKKKEPKYGEMQTHGSFQAGVLSQAVNENGTVHPKLPVSLKFVGPNRRDAQYFNDTRSGGSDWGVEHGRRSDIQLKSMGSILDHRSTNHGTSQSALVSFVDELPYESRGNRYPPNHDPKANDVGKGNGILMNSKYQEYSVPHDDLESAVSHKRAKSGIGSEEDGTTESEGRTVVAIREEYHMQGRASPLDQIRSAWRRDRGGRGGKSRRLSASITGQIRLEDGTVFDRIEPTSPSQSRSYSPVSSPQFFRPTRDSNEREKRKESPLPGIFVTTTTTTTTT